MRGPSFIGLGNLPDFTPAHQVLLDTGIIAGTGGLLFGSPMMLCNRTKPVSGKIMSFSYFFRDLFMIPFLISGKDLCRPMIRQVEENSKTWSMGKQGNLFVLLQTGVNVNLFHASGLTIVFHGV